MAQGAHTDRGSGGTPTSLGFSGLLDLAFFFPSLFFFWSKQLRGFTHRVLPLHPGKLPVTGQRVFTVTRLSPDFEVATQRSE